MANRLLKLLADNRAQASRKIEIRAEKGAKEAEIFIYDAIVSDEIEAEWYGGVAPQSFVKALREIDADTIHLRINSPGGSVFAARAIETALREHKAKVVAHIDGLAASAATFIAMAADEIVMAPGALFMIHKAWTVSFGNADDLRTEAALLEKIDGTLAETYAARSGKEASAMMDLMAAETWFTAQEAVDAGLVDKIAETESKAKAAWNLSAYDKAPKAEIQPEPEPQPEPKPEHAQVDAAALKRRLDVTLLTA
jgi:ATP-dependent Clp protease protease subunit